MRRFALIWLCIWFGLQAQASEIPVVRVGGYAFPPFVDTLSGTPKGVTLDLLDALNRIQARYRFEFILTTPQERYQDLAYGIYDLIFFENLLWGWHEQEVDVSREFLTGGEVYIALALPGRDQRFFDQLKGKSKAGILGYHYGFASFDATPERLRSNYRMTLVTDHRALMDTVLSGRVDLAVVSSCYLSYHLRQTPAAAAGLLISERYDQIYRHTALVRKGSPIRVGEINQMLDTLDKTGLLDEIRKKYCILSHQRLESLKRPLVVGVSFAIPPYVIKDADRGIELDLLRQAFAVTGRNVTIKYLPLTRTFHLLEAGKLDGVINIKEGMLGKVFYSDPVLKFQNVAISLAKKGYPPLPDPEFLKGKYIIAFQRAPQILGPAFAGIAAANPRYEEVADQENQIFRLFLERHADFIVLEKQIFNYYRKRAIERNTIGPRARMPVVFHALFPPTPYRFAFKDETIRDEFNRGLKAIRHNGTYSRIMKSYDIPAPD